MKLKSIEIRSFKRFKDLTIADLPKEAKLVVMLGPNGCGKSSLFDAFQRFLKVDQFYGMSEEFVRYYRRGANDADSETENVRLNFYGSNPETPEDLKKSLYIRSAYRHDPSFQDTTIAQQDDILDRHAVRRMIDTDRTVQDNYQRMIWKLLRLATTPDKRTNDIVEEVIGDLRRSMERIFGDITVDALVSVDQVGTFTFTKGVSQSFPYENLSGGEKAAFDLLLDIVVNKAAFNDSLYCIDEPEVHMNTRVQRTLLEELYRLVPDNSQLWIATHSIGMVRAAQEMRAKRGIGEIVFLDFGYDVEGNTRNYDESQLITPSETDQNFWHRHYTVALDDLAELLAPSCIVLCEGSTLGSDMALDQACYSKIFASEFPETRFISVGSRSNVEKRMRELVPVLSRIVSKTNIVLFRDRDDSTQEEIEERRRQEVPVRTMSEYRNIESLLVSNGVLERLCAKFKRPESYSEIISARNSALDAHLAGDDFKPAVQAVHHAAKKELEIAQSGDTKEAFLRDILTPLVKKGTPEYDSLKSDIFGCEES